MESWPAFEGGKYQGMLLVTLSISEDDVAYPQGTVSVNGSSGFSTEPYTPNWPNSPWTVTFHVDWGDGTTEEVTATSWLSRLNHRYSAPGNYDVIVYGLPVPTSSRNDYRRLASINGPLPGPWKDSNISTMFLESISENAFDWYKKNSDQYQWRYDYFDEFFEDCISLKKVPGGLFDGIAFYTDENHSLSLKRLFHNCQSLEEIGAGFFDNPAFQGVVNAENMFEQCSSLETIRAGLLSNLVGVTSFNSCFLNSGIREIQEDIFQHNVNAVSFVSCFQNCTNLRNVSGDILDSITTTTPNLNSMFAYCTNLEHAPELWLKFPDISGTSLCVGCFRFCTRADNYAEIPGSWK